MNAQIWALDGVNDDGIHPYTLTSHLAAVKDAMFQIKLPRSVFLIIDPNVNRLWRHDIDKIFSSDFSEVLVYIAKEGEQAKQIGEVKRQWQIMQKNNFGKDSTVIAIGGGTTGDAAGFLSSIYMRGVSFVLLPTTLLAMIDSSIGGKNGINTAHAKNLLGTIRMPNQVYACTAFLKTLPEEEWLCGYGEVLKYALLTRSKSLRALISKEWFFPLPAEDIIYRFVQKCVKEKMRIVTEDPFENELRKILNLGHTFAHAFEAASKYTIPHGRAVHAGLAASLFLSRELKLLSEKQLSEMLRLLTGIPYDQRVCSLDLDLVMRKMQSDKKNIGKELRFVLLSGYGRILWNVSAHKEKVFDSLMKTLRHLERA